MEDGGFLHLISLIRFIGTQSAMSGVVIYDPGLATAMSQKNPEFDADGWCVIISIYKRRHRQSQEGIELTED